MSLPCSTLHQHWCRESNSLDHDHLQAWLLQCYPLRTTRIKPHLPTNCAKYYSKIHQPNPEIWPHQTCHERSSLASHKIKDWIHDSYQEYTSLHGSTPIYLRESLCRRPDRGTRHDAQNNLAVPKAKRTNFGARTFQYAGPKLWNSLSNDLKNLSRPNTFTKNLKTYLLNKSFK